MFRLDLLIRRVRCLPLKKSRTNSLTIDMPLAACMMQLRHRYSLLNHGYAELDFANTSWGITCAEQSNSGRVTSA